MSRMTFLGVYREEIFSPGKVEADAAILNATLQQLSLKGCEVSAVRAEGLGILPVQPDCALMMAQSDRVLRILEGWHRSGTRIINSISSIRKCYRKSIVPVLAKARIPIPPGTILPLDELGEDIFFGSSIPYWLKRGDVHALHPSDVIQVASGEALRRAVDHFRRQGVEEVLVQEHVEGEVIKFYGVGIGQYFRAFLASNGEEVTSAMGPLSWIARRSAEVVGLEIYGGDAIVTPKGDVVLIDLNDWPSFSRCCQSAAREIAGYVTGIFKGGIDALSTDCRNHP